MTCCFFQRTGDLVAMRTMCEPPHPVVSGHDALLLILSGTGWGCAGCFHMPWKQSELGLCASEGNRVRGVASMRLLVPRSTCPCLSGHVHPQGGSFPSRGNKSCWELAVGAQAEVQWGCSTRKRGTASAPDSATICQWPLERVFSIQEWTDADRRVTRGWSLTFSPWTG